MSACEVETIIACSERVSEEKAAEFKEQNIKIVKCPERDSEIDLTFLVKKLGEMEIDGILLEGGGILNASMLRAGLVDQVDLFIAPMILGGDAKTIVGGKGVEHLKDAWHFSIKGVEKCGEDLHVILRKMI